MIKNKNDHFENKIGERLQNILDYLKIRKATFAKNCKLSNYSLLDGWISGEYEPTVDSLNKIINRYPEISRDWLFFGIGDMWIDEEYYKKRFDKLGLDKNTAAEKISALLEIYECSYTGLKLHLGFSKDLIYSIKRGQSMAISVKSAMKASRMSKFIPLDWFMVK